MTPVPLSLEPTKRSATAPTRIDVGDGETFVIA